ncbi:MAG: serine/threonine-protein kinase [Myxococcota bacterium]|nr:serine/threonine-protein kinase [Myxococcota bacterium]
MSNENAQATHIDVHKTLSIIGLEVTTLTYEYDEVDGIEQASLADIDAQLKTLDTIGSGGVGVVFAAKQHQLDRTVAIKQLKMDVSQALLSRLLEHEAKITGKLEHPNILPIYMYGRIEGHPTIVMKKLDGETWTDRIKAKPYHGEVSDLIPRIRILQEVGNAVAYAHSRGIIHRDIKPDNIHLGTHGEVFLLDWGLAIELGKPNIFPSKVLVGTPAYMPPEMANTEIYRQDHRTDIYLLGASLYEAIFGTSPHQGSQIPEVLDSIRERTPLQFPREIPQILQTLLARAMAHDLEDRYKSMESFLSALETTKTTIQYLPFIKNIQQQADLIQTAIGYELEDWKDNLESMILSYSALRKEHNERDLERKVTQTLVMAINQEIERENPSYARRIFERLPQPVPEIEHRLLMVEKRTQLELEHYSEWQRQNDPDAGMSYRMWASGILTVVWGVIAWVLYASPQITYKSSWGWGVTLLIFGVFHKGFRITARNRNIGYSIGMLIVCTISGAMVSSALDVPFEMRMAFVQMAYGVSLGLMGILIAPVFWMAAIPFWLSALLVAYYPEYNDVWTSLSKSMAFGGMTLFWFIKNPTAIRLSFHIE